MAGELTNDPDVVIEERRLGYIRYRNTAGRRWEAVGQCAWDDPTRWGPCGEGAVESPPGPPEGRMDIPDTPEFSCSLCVDGGHLVLRDV